MRVRPSLSYTDSSRRACPSPSVSKMARRERFNSPWMPSKARRMRMSSPVLPWTVALQSFKQREISSVTWCYAGGGQTGPQYTSEWVKTAAECLKNVHSQANIVVDCSHGNSQKVHRNQIRVARDIAQQIRDGESQIVGVMIESHIHEGNQIIPSDGSVLRYGQSVTDACINRYGRNISRTCRCHKTV